MYHALCLDHDPAIVIDGDWQHPDYAVEAVANRSTDVLRPHRTCQMMIGRYSYPLIEVCCPGASLHPDRPMLHTRPVWMRVEWLRLLYAAYQSKDEAVLKAARGMDLCWSAVRLLRLRHELGVADPEPTP